MEKKHNIVYKTVNLINSKFYIGVHATNNLDDGYLGSGKLLKFAFKKYGKNNFKRYILHDFITADSAYGVEKVIVDKYFISRDDNYNTTIGGKGRSNFTVTEETKLKISKALKGVKQFKRHPLSEQHKDKISKALKGKPLTEETKHKMSISSKGKLLTEETKRKISIANKSDKSPKAKKVKCFTTGEVFNCIMDAVRKYNIPQSSITRCCQDNYKWTGKLPDGTKLVWRYV